MKIIQSYILTSWPLLGLVSAEVNREKTQLVCISTDYKPENKIANDGKVGSSDEFGAPMIVTANYD